MPTKQELRKKINQLKLEFSDSQWNKWQKVLDQQILHFFSAKARSGIWAGYRALHREASLEKAFDKIDKKKFQWCFPRIEQEDTDKMDFYLVKNFSRDFEKGAFGILQPKKTCEKIDRKNITAAIFPVLAFDLHGTRLGRGRGFYDRYFANFSGQKLGLAFYWQYSSDLLPKDKHDITLEYIITEQKIMQF